MGEPRAYRPVPARPALAAAAAAAALATVAAFGGDDDPLPLDLDAATDARPADAAPDAAPDAATGAPALALDAASYDLGPTPVLVTGETRAATLTLTNSGDAPATGLTLAASPATAELRLLSNCGAALAAQASCTILAQLDPTIAGAKTFVVTVAAAEGAGPSATVTGLAGARVRLSLSTVAVGTTTTDGRVVSAPAGLDCGLGMTACEHVFTTAAPIVLTATDDGNGTLSEWGAPDCPVTGPCTLAPTRNHTLPTTFHAPLAVTSASPAGTADQADGVALDSDLGVVLAGRRGDQALVTRLDGVAGEVVTAATFGPAPRHALAVAVAADRTIATAGVEGDDLVVASAPLDLQTEPVKHLRSGGAGRGRAICHDAMNRIYAAGDQGSRMAWGRWPAGASTPEWFVDATTPSGTALAVACDAEVLWVGGALADQTGWLGKLDAATGAVLTPTPVAGTRKVGGVATSAALGAGHVVVAGSTADTLVVRRYDEALAEVWTRTFAAAADVTPGVAIDPVTGAIYVAYVTTGGCALRKLTAAGAPVWVRSGLGAHCQAVAADGDGAVVAGWTTVGADRKYFVRKYFH